MEAKLPTTLIAGDRSMHDLVAATIPFTHFREARILSPLILLPEEAKQVAKTINLHKDELLPDFVREFFPDYLNMRQEFFISSEDVALMEKGIHIKYGIYRVALGGDRCVLIRLPELLSDEEAQQIKQFICITLLEADRHYNTTNAEN